MLKLSEVGQKHSRITHFAVLAIAVPLFIFATACTPDMQTPVEPVESEPSDVWRASFSRWEVSTVGERKIFFYNPGTTYSGRIDSAIEVPIGKISAKVLTELSPGTAVVSGDYWNQEVARGFCNGPFSCFKKATLFVSSQAEADAWNRYFAELLADREKEMREEWAPKKIQPPPTLQKSD